MGRDCEIVDGNPKPTRTQKEAEQYLLDLLLDTLRHRETAEVINSTMATACVTVGYLYNLNPVKLAMHCYLAAGYTPPKGAQQ